MSDQYYEWYPGDYQRDTADLTLIEHGAYRVLLDIYYSTGGVIPTDFGRIFRSVRAQKRAEKNAVTEIVTRFFPIGNDGLRHNARADRQIQERQAFCQAQQLRGAIGAKKRWGEHSNIRIANAIPNAIAYAMPNGIANGIAQAQPDYSPPSPSPSIKEKIDKREKPTRAKRATQMPDNFVLSEDMTKYASDAGIDPMSEFEAFKDFHLSKGSVFRDWPAAWRTWIRNAIKFNRGKTPTEPQGRTYEEITGECKGCRRRVLLDAESGLCASCYGAAPMPEEFRQAISKIGREING